MEKENTFTIKRARVKKGDIVLDEIYKFERNKDYVSGEFLTTEDEIRDICKKNKILVQKIAKYDGYEVIGKKVRMRKTYEKASKLLN